MPVRIQILAAPRRQAFSCEAASAAGSRLIANTAGRWSCRLQRFSQSTAGDVQAAFGRKAVCGRGYHPGNAGMSRTACSVQQLRVARADADSVKMYLSVLPISWQSAPLPRFVSAQRPVLVGKQHRAHPEAPPAASVQMQLDGGKQAFQHRLPAAGAVQNLKAGIVVAASYSAAHTSRAAPHSAAWAQKQLRAAVRRVGVGVLMTARQLAQLAHRAPPEAPSSNVRRWLPYPAYLR